MGGVCFQNQQGVQVRYQSVTYFITHEPNSTIRQLKANMQKENHVPSRDVTLFYKGNKINDFETLQSMGFSINNDILVMQKASHDSSQLTISIRSINFTEEIKVQPSQTVEDLKRKIEEKRKLPISRQRLIFSGKILIDTQTLSSQGITDKSTVHCTTPLVA